MNNSQAASIKSTLIAAFVFILTLYGILYYLVLTYQYRLDFSSFYSACQAMSDGENPYRVLLTTYFPTVKKLSANLNPPAALILFMPFSWMNYFTGVAVWSLLSFILGGISAGLAFYYALPKAFYKKYRLILFLMYLSLFPILINSAIAQVGSLLSFLILYGYHLQVKNKNWGAAICWGTASAIKLFPALLIFYALFQKRYKLGGYFILVFALWSIIPLLIYGPSSYTDYFTMVPKVLWYGDNWNASLYGFLFRLLVGLQNTKEDILIVNCLFILLFCMLMFWYWYRLQIFIRQNQAASGFALTLAMMLFLSPFGWFYYFGLLVFPLCVTWVYAFQNNIKNQIRWLFCFFLLNFPMDYVRTLGEAALLAKLTLYSFQFYGLALLIYLINQIKSERASIHIKDKNYLLTVPISILAFGTVVLLLSFAKHYIPEH